VHDEYDICSNVECYCGAIHFAGIMRSLLSM
jgi:hypothetical protein